ncbi:MAG: hypothetical protein AAFV77_11515 [Planctomycetota bacterium]
MPRLCQCTVLTAALAIAACPPAATAASQDELPQDEIEAVEPAAELPEAIRNLLLGVGTPSRGGEGMLAVEGSILPERAGLIRRTPYGEWAFVFVRDDGQPAAMVLLPCRQLERMVESVQATNATAIRLTGRLTVYESVNYVLPTNYSIISTETASSELGDESQPATDPLNQIDPMLREVAEQSEAGRIRARSLQAPPMAPPSIREPTGTPSTDTEQAIETDALQEGDNVLRRRARLERQRGLWTLRFDDSDQETSAAAAQAPLIVLPNSALRSMEQSVRRYGDQIAFEVSGTVYRYGRQPYVLISMHFAQPLEGLRPRG